MRDATPQTLPPATATLLSDFARSCKAAVRAVSLYPGRHPAIAASLGRLVETTTRLTAQGPLKLQIRADTLFIEDAGLPKPDSAVSELAGLLHGHLLGAMTVNHGADVDSWRTLLLLLSRSPADVRADGGIAHLWGTAGGPSIELREIDYAEVLREKHGSASSLDDIIAAALDGAQVQIDDDSLELLLSALDDPVQLEELMERLESAAPSRGGNTKVTAVLKLLQTVAARLRQDDPQRLDAALRQLGHLAARLSADDMLQLLAHRERGEEGEAVDAVVARMEDGDVARFLADSVIAERGATARLAHAFQALVPDTDRQRRLLALAGEQVAASPVGEETRFEDLWQQVESMVSSYSDASYVSEAYGRELWHAQKRAVEVERAGDDPPERIAAWLTTVADAALRGLDHHLLNDLLAIEQDVARWIDVAETAAAHAEDLVRVGYFDQAWSLADTVIREARAVPEREAHLPRILQGFGRAAMMKHVAAYLRIADDEAFERFERLCRALGTPIIVPLAEALSAEQDARARRRLRDLLVGFGAQGRDAVQQLMHAPNWEVRRTAAFLLREFGGAEGLRELMPLLTDNEPLVQREAVQALVLNGSDAAAAILIEALGTVSGRARETLVGELSGMRDPRASPLFCYLVRHLDRARHAPVYLAALEALGAFDDPDAIGALKDALHRGDWWAPFRTRKVRSRAAAALRRIGTPSAIDVLRAAATTGGRGTRAAARAQLAQLG